MKKTICALLAAVILLTITGCQPPEATVPATTELQIPENDLFSGPALSVSVPITTDTYLADDNAVLLEYSHQHIRLTLPNQAVADRITVDFLNRIDSNHQNVEALLEMAKSVYTAGSNWIPYQYEISYSPTRIDQGILSLFGTTVSYTGGLHPDRIMVAANYDMLTGEALTLGSILTHVDKKDTLCRNVIDALSDSDYLYSLYEGYEEIIYERFNQDESVDEDFYFTHTGLCFYFAPYEIAPYASGLITAEIPYEKLTGIIDDAFFPPETNLSCGTLKAQIGTPSFEHISELIIDHDCTEIYLSADTAIYDVKIEVGTWSEDGLYFTPQQTLFATTGIGPNDAILLQTKIPDVLPNLLVSYHTPQGDVSYYISQSGENGEILLINAE